VLAALPPEEYARLLPHLEPRAVAALEVLADAERPLAHVYFPETGIISVLRRMRDGTLIEAYAVGRDGMVGIPRLLGDLGSPAGTILGEVPGMCRRVALGTLCAMLPELPALEALTRRLLLALLEQVQQAVACNSLHTVEQRCARWLLMTHDRVGGDELLLTHDVLAQMLAVRRAGVTVAAGVLQKAGLITYSRGRVRVLDRAGLQAAACECYAVIAAHTDRLLGMQGGASD
jgi:CRP-like cAMP-binding protein